MVSAGRIGSRYKMERALSIPLRTTVLLAKEFGIGGRGNLTRLAFLPTNASRL